MAKYQFTLYSDKYKPVSCIVEAESRMDFTAYNRVKYKEALQKICAKRHWTMDEIKEYGYIRYKTRKMEEQ